MNKTRIILSLAVMIFISLSVKAQNSERSEAKSKNQTVLKVIGVNDYENFLTIDGLKQYSNIKYKGLHARNSTRYTVKSTNAHMSLLATYGADGNLIEAKLTTYNSRLPRVIRDYMVTDNYKAWTMTSNKVIVYDFDVKKTEYEIEMQREKEKQTLYFDYLGNRTKNQTVLKMIGVSDYKNFLTIEGLKQYSNINYEGLEEGPAKKYVVESKNQHMSLLATYNKDGNLVKGKLTTNNSRLPKAVRDYLVTDNYKAWTMTSNKVIVRDFDVKKTEYEIKMQREKEKQTLYFDHLGNRIDRLSRS